MPLTKIKAQNIKPGAITEDKIETNTLTSLQSSGSLDQAISDYANNILSITSADIVKVNYDEPITNITIQGTNFFANTQVYVNDEECDFTFVSSVELSVTVPNNLTGFYDIYLKNYDGQSAISFSKVEYTNANVSLWTWGYNVRGQLGLNDEVQRSSPTQIGTDTDWYKLSYFLNQNVAIKRDGTLWTWGHNIRGQLGLGDSNSRSSPTQVGSLTNWKKVATDYDKTFAIKTDGTLWSWGSGSEPRIVAGSSTDKSSPIQVGTDSDWYSIHFNDSDKAVAIKTDGTLWMWGDNAYGQLGDNTVVTKHEPTKIGTDSWSKAVCGGSNSIGIKSDGTLWTWGDRTKGALGLNSITENKSSPTQVGSDTWKDVTAHESICFAIKTDGSLWVWGGSGIREGQLGLNDSAASRSISSPTQVGSDTNWKNIFLSSSNAVALKTDGSLWVWGRSDYGRLGLNFSYESSTNNNNVSSPTQVGTDTNWYSVFPGAALRVS
jgi:alpha-tubulin suppressor-like RCC1 family protein